MSLKFPPLTTARSAPVTAHDQSFPVSVILWISFLKPPSDHCLISNIRYYAFSSIVSGLLELFFTACLFSNLKRHCCWLYASTLVNNHVLSQQDMQRISTRRVNKNITQASQLSDKRPGVTTGAARAANNAACEKFTTQYGRR